jgi:hypothetical protein
MKPLRKIRICVKYVIADGNLWLISSHVVKNGFSDPAEFAKVRRPI